MVGESKLQPVKLIAVALVGGLSVTMAMASSAPRISAGGDAGSAWIEVGADGWEGDFRLAASPGREAGCRITFPDLPGGEERTLSVDLPHPVSLRVAPSAMGAGTELAIPFSLASLSSVERMVDGWRFTFAAPGRSSPSSDAGADEYHLGARDVIEITVFGHPDLSRMETVPSGGVLPFPLIGDIRLGGRTTGEIQRELAERLGADYLVDPHVSVRIREYESQWVNVVGQVRQPGKYPLKGVSTLIDMITEAGGLTNQAGSEIVVTRQDEDTGEIRQIRIDRDGLFSEHNEEHNLALRMGDVVEAVDQEVFYIQGEVNQPGSYPLERGYTLLKAITVAGGFSQWADRKGVELLREENGEQRKILVNLKAVGERREPDVELRPEDIIIVKRRLL